TMTIFRPCEVSAAIASAALEGDVVMMVRMPAPRNRPSFRTRKSPGVMPPDPGISTATLAAAAGLVSPRQANTHTLARSTLRVIGTLHILHEDTHALLEKVLLENALVHNALIGMLQNVDLSLRWSRRLMD